MLIGTSLAISQTRRSGVSAGGGATQLPYTTTERHPDAVGGFLASEWASAAAYLASVTAPPYSYVSQGDFSKVGDLFVMVSGGTSQINSDIDPVGAPWDELWCNYSFTLDAAFASDTWVGLPLISDNGNDFYALAGMNYDPVLEKFYDYDGFNYPYPLASLKGVEHIVTLRARGKSGATPATETHWLNGALVGPEHNIVDAGTAEGVGNCGTYFATRQGDAATYPNAKISARLCDFVPGDGVTPPWSGLAAG